MRDEAWLFGYIGPFAEKEKEAQVSNAHPTPESRRRAVARMAEIRKEMKERKLAAESAQKFYQIIPVLEANKFLIDFKEPDERRSSRVGPFVARWCQKAVDTKISPEWLRHIILKARQIGVSTYVDLRLLAKCLLVDGTRAVIISHERNATSRLLRKVHMALEDLIDRKVKFNGVPVETKYSTKYEISFPRTHSSLYIGTAGQRAFSRGDSLTDVHGSEVAFWENAVEMMRGIEGALTPTAEVFLESTANGMGGYFYDLVQKCLDNTGPYLLHFFPWNEDPELTLPVPGNAVFSAEEAELGRRFNLTQPQLWWRRKKLDKYETIADFQQEFPLTVEESFIISGTCFFDKESLRENSHRTIKPVLIGDAEVVGNKAIIRANPDGPVQIYRHPAYNGSYIIGADCSEGVEGGDLMAACVLDRERCQEAAWISGFLDPEEAAKELFALGQLYNWAWIAVEEEKAGLAVLTSLRRLGYPRLYQRVDIMDETRTPRLGFRTDERTRPLILGAIRSMLKRRVWGVADEGFLKECSTFCRQNNHRYAANFGSHDDKIMAAAIAAYLHGIVAPDTPQSEIDREVRRGGPVQPIRRGLKTGY